MKTVKKIITAQFGYYPELSMGDKDLLAWAFKARKNAQAPYSNYYVGVAVRSAFSGMIYSGCNVERASYTQTTHAEQNAIDSMVRQEGPVKIHTLALVAAPASDKGGEFMVIAPYDNQALISAIDQIPVPCGHCLQIIWENCFNDQSVRLIAKAPNGQIVVTTIGDALPMKFGPKELGVDYSKIAK